MSAGRADDGAEDGELIHLGGDAREDLADLDAVDAGGDGAKLTPYLAGSLGLDVPHVLVRRSAAQDDIDNRLRPTPWSLGGASLSPQDVGKGQ